MVVATACRYQMHQTQWARCKLSLENAPQRAASAAQIGASGSFATWGWCPQKLAAACCLLLAAAAVAARCLLLAAAFATSSEVTISSWGPKFGDAGVQELSPMADQYKPKGKEIALILPALRPGELDEWEMLDAIHEAQELDGSCPICFL